MCENFLKTPEPFGPLFMCHYTDTTPMDSIDEDLKRLWLCEWSTERLDEIFATFDSWRSKLDRDREYLASAAECREIFICGIELLLIFVQHNFTGPFQQLAELQDFLARKDLSEHNPFVRLMANGEQVNPNVKLGELLVIANNIFERLLRRLPMSLFLRWWQMRLLCIHQSILDDLASDLYKKLQQAAEVLMLKSRRIGDAALQPLLCPELSNAFLQFHRVQKSSELLNEVCSALKVSLTVTGFLGKRTKHQQQALPQMCLQVEKKADYSPLPSAEETNGSTKLPGLLLLDDDTRLERIVFEDPKHNEVLTLASALQALILAKAKELRRSQPTDRLADEEVQPYMRTLLCQESGPLQVRLATLLLNCEMERNHRRTVERSWKQCEEILRIINAADGFTFQQRLSFAFAAFLQPRWQVQMRLGALLLSLGMTKSALNLYLEVQAWPEVIECYTRLELRHKAAEVIREQLALKPTALLYCLLGDATDDPQWYEKAWHFSGCTSGKAQTHWGDYLMRRKEYPAAVEHYEKSVEINALQERVWLRLGYGALILERWELAARAYLTYTHIDTQSFEAWNNLGKALIKLGNKQRAHKILHEALRCNYSNWRVWENYMLVSIDTGHFDEALMAYARLSELKDRYFDLEVLRMLAKAILDGKPDARGQPRHVLVLKLNKVLEQQCVSFANEPELLELAVETAQTPLAKAQRLVHLYRALSAKDLTWVERQDDAKRTVAVCVALCRLSLEAITSSPTEGETDGMVTSQLNSARLCAKSLVSILERSSEVAWPISEALQELNPLLEGITTKLQARMQQT